jgi:hypothetical protein
VGEAIQCCDSHYATGYARTLGRLFRVIASSKDVVIEFISSFRCIVAKLVKMSSTDINKELLIALIEERPVLWKKSDDSKTATMRPKTEARALHLVAAVSHGHFLPL